MLGAWDDSHPLYHSILSHLLPVMYIAAQVPVDVYVKSGVWCCMSECLRCSEVLSLNAVVNR